MAEASEVPQPYSGTSLDNEETEMRKMAQDNVEILAERAKYSVNDLGGRNRGRRTLPPDAEIIASKFRAYDQNDDGLMSLDELSTLIEECETGLSKVEIEVLFEHVDKDKDGKISIEQWLEWLMH
eukprot:TRINITY_DN6539_c0_g1_i4.p2 TRINITY_DN6539_c0_g1~~TRINITY_DN6539_c0_g1_i4.p2  ORF type:complete len:125 (+),score=17.52 TRINITY_DN6539_c0_g1_i4:87-461(+)